MPGKPRTQTPVEPAEPPFYLATEDLFVGGHAGTMPVAAFRKGDQVHPGLLDHHGWRGKVAVPDDYLVPDEPTPDPAEDAASPADDAAGKE